MENEQKSPKRYDYLDRLENGEKISQELLDNLKAKNTELHEMLEISNLLRDSKKTKPSAKFARESKVRLFYRAIEPHTQKLSLLESISQYIANFSIPKPLKLSPVYGIIFAIIVSFSLMVGGVQAADNAGPGSFLYPVDLAMEDIQLFLTRSAEHRMNLQIGFAQERLQEAEEAYEQDDTLNAEVALANFETQVVALDQLFDESQSDLPENIQEILELSEKNNTAVLVNLLDQVPESAQDAILHAIEVSSGIKKNSPNPSGLEDKATPPGQEDKKTPPGQEDKTTPPGLEDKETPPGLEDKDKDKETPPGLEDKDTPPGLEDKDKDKDG
ncbi:hypothetical protein KQH54_01870 [bacterium]|nr:hypothetical protein [bacterium]